MSCSCCQQDPIRKDSALALLLEWITQFSPHQNYGIWMYLNACVLLWSLLFLFEFFMTDDIKATRARIEGTEAYLVYSFGSMLIWVLGAGLHLLDHVYVHQIVARWKHPELDSSKQYCGPEEQRLLKSCIGKNDRYDSLDLESNATTNPKKTIDANEEEKEQRETKRFDLYAILFEFILSIYFLDYSRRAFVKWNTPDADVAEELMDTLINIGAFSYQVVRMWKIRHQHIAEELAEIDAHKAEAEEEDTDAESNDAQDEGPELSRSYSWYYLNG